jgi:hypothetical protein
MTEQNDPLLEWNRLNISNAEREIARAFFLGTLSSSEHADRFSTWLLAGIAGTAALFVTQISSILPFLSEGGFKRCGGILVVAGLLGLLAKQRAVWVRMALEQNRVIEQLMLPALQKHEEDEDEIRDFAQKRGLEIQTEIDIRRASEAFISAFPKILRGRLRKQLEIGLSNPHSHLRGVFKNFLYQILFTASQVFFFLVFVVLAVAHAAAI